MHSHTIALAAADARVPDLQRAATHTRATAPSRRRRRTFVLLALAATAALCTLAPTGAFARPIGDATTPANARIDPAPAPKPAQDLRAHAKTSSLAGTTAARPDTSTTRADALRHANQAAPARQDLRSPDARDAAEGRGTFNSPRVVVVKVQPKTRPALTHGIDWADAGIGAAAGLGLSMAAVGGGLIAVGRRRHRRYATAP